MKQTPVSTIMLAPSLGLMSNKAIKGDNWILLRLRLSGDCLISTKPCLSDPSLVWYLRLVPINPLKSVPPQTARSLDCPRSPERPKPPVHNPIQKQCLTYWTMQKSRSTRLERGLPRQNKFNGGLLVVSINTSLLWNFELKWTVHGDFEARWRTCANLDNGVKSIGELFRGWNGWF